ncbi:asparagine synthase (glutamine-hydrolyzing) [Streptomyces noursei]|uniref:asparagine synthase (glutamine-hydrolyzing) n=1 Tax=Streptomyces noursei TaxID=1971 RepID=UPI0039AF3F40
MCGIVGVVASRSLGEEVSGCITSMLSSIHHRGPDEAGYYLDDGVAMGTVRLAIIDLESGAQPMSDPGERHWICFNGELYNHVELREELRRLGRPFRTKSDTEVVLQAWIQWGPECLTRFNGAFALAIRDNEAGTLFLARDRYGKRPLFYTEYDGALLFASEMKAFAAYPGFRFEFDARELASVYTLWAPLPGRTPFQGVRQVPAGGLLSVEGGRHAVTHYEELRVDGPAFDGDEREAVAFVRETLRRSVEVRLRSDVEVGVYLSGGLDSSIVTKLAAEQSAHEVRTFSVEFADRTFDESSSQQLVASHLGTRHSALRVSHRDIADSFADAVWHAEVPAFRTSFVPMYLLSRHVRDAGIKTVLSGEGADEAFLGYSLFRETMLRESWNTLSEEDRLRRLATLHPELAHFGAARRSHLLGLFQQFSTERTPGLFSHELRYQNGMFATRLLKHPGDPLEAMRELVRGTPGYHRLTAVQKAQWIEYKTLLAGYLLATQGERASLAHSVENRAPFLDPSVVRAAASVNLRYDDGSDEKAILKNAFADDLPQWTLSRPKQPYRAPGSAVFKEQRPDCLELVLSENELRRIDCVNPVFAGKLVSKIMRAPVEQISTKEDQAFVYLLSTAILNQQFVLAGQATSAGVAYGPKRARMNLRTTVDKRRVAVRTGADR